MNWRKQVLWILATLGLPTLLLAQGTTAALVDLTTNTVLSHFTVGNNPNTVAWADNSTAYITNDADNTLVRLNMTTTPPSITATYTFVDPAFEPHGLAINPAGTRALVTGDTFSVYLLDLTTTPFTVVDTIPLSIIDAGGVAFYSAGTRGWSRTSRTCSFST